MGSEKNWLGGVATYTGGKSYTVAGHHFVFNRPTKLRTKKARDAVHGKPGFHVVDRWEEGAEEAEPEEAPKAEATGAKKVKVAKKLLKGGKGKDK